MTDYLVDIASGKVLLLVRGPIIPGVGQKIVRSKEEIPVRLARYDADEDVVVRVTESTLRRKKKQAKKEKMSGREAMNASREEFRSLWLAQTPEIRKLLRLMVEIPDSILAEAMNEESQEATPPPHQ